jgi:hypothetical protein
MPATTSEISWFWIGVALTAPTAIAFLVALPWWRKGRDAMFGNVLGAGIIFAAAIGFIGREYVELERAYAGCVAAGLECANEPIDFTRIGIYGVIAFAEVIALFGVSLVVEERARRRLYAREWR